MTTQAVKIPKISVCMPAYNAERFIGEAIESILNQTFEDFELIIIDDASTDNTWKIIQDYAKKDNRVIAIQNEKNLNIGGNRNKLISIAKGEYIIWQDADDISYHNRLSLQLQYMEKHHEVGICGGYLDSFSEKNKISDTRTYLTNDKELRACIFRQSPVAQPSAIIRRSCFLKVGNYNINYPPAEDIDMSFRIGTYYKFANLALPLIMYREHHNSATYQKLRKILITTLLIRIKNIRNDKYKFTLIDLGYQLLTILCLVIPPKITVSIFKRYRKK